MDEALDLGLGLGLEYLGGLDWGWLVDSCTVLHWHWHLHLDIPIDISGVDKSLWNNIKFMINSNWLSFLGKVSLVSDLAGVSSSYFLADYHPSDLWRTLLSVLK